MNQFVATATGLSRRAADTAVADGQVTINERVAELGDQVLGTDVVRVGGATVSLPDYQTILLHKPVGYVTSRRQQGKTPTIYALLPKELHRLKPVGRLDRDSSGVLLLTNDGRLAHALQHPSSGKLKHYSVWLDRPLKDYELQQIGQGVELKDGVSHMKVRPEGDHYLLRLGEGRNRQIRRSFAALGRRVIKLHRAKFGDYELGDLTPGAWRTITEPEA